MGGGGRQVGKVRSQVWWKGGGGEGQGGKAWARRHGLQGNKPRTNCPPLCPVSSPPRGSETLRYFLLGDVRRDSSMFLFLSKSQVMLEY